VYATASVAADVNTVSPVVVFAVVIVLFSAALLVCATVLCYVYATATVAADVNTVSTAHVFVVVNVLAVAALLVCTTFL